jgi:hypothetical protein
MILSNVDGLSAGSNKIIIAKCDYCNSEIEISYKRYNRSMKIGNKFSCSRSCASKKKIFLLEEKYGVSNVSQLDSIKEKRKLTNLEKYGVECPFSSVDIRNKIKKSLIEKYGVDNPLKSLEIKEKIKKSSNLKYGHDYYICTDEFREKSKKTNLEKYGFENPSKSQNIKDKIILTNNLLYGYNSPLQNSDIFSKSKETIIKNYGVDNPLKSEEVKERIKKTNLEKYGVEYPMQSKEIKETRNYANIEKWGYKTIQSLDEYRKQNTKIGSDINYIEYLGNKISKFTCDNGHEFEIHTDNFFSRKRQGIIICTICNPIGNPISSYENEIFNFIKNIYKKNIIQSYRDQLEIDIYLPDLKLGFEFNGLYWHSDKEKSKNYHLIKTNYFKERGIRIIHIWEDDWIFKTNIIKSQILNLLKLTSDKIFARKCEVKPIEDSKLINNFLNHNHIQGYVNSVIKLGLYYNDELVSIMTFDQFEGRKKMNDDEWNLSRFCNKINTNVIGGASKLLNYFIKNYNPTRIISYADKDWSIGNLYEKLGFSLVKEINPDYKYIINGRRVHKSRFRKSYTGVSESKIKMLKIYDCGKLKYELLKLY